MTRLFFLFVLTISFFCTNVLYSQEQKLSKPEKTFEFFWSYFNDNYAFFEEKNIDWDIAYKEYRHKITKNTSDNELFAILCAMVKPFNDSHVNITSAKESYSASRPSRVREDFKGYNLYDYYAMIDSTLYSNGFNPMVSKGSKINGIPLFNYCSNDKYGYLRINRCAGTRFYTTGRLSSLDKVLKKFSDKEALIIDIRFNPGGTDNFAFKVAGRFTNKKYIGLYKQKRIEKCIGLFSEMESCYVKPKGEINYLKPIVLLTNDVTVSAGDVFALIMRELEQVIIIGENTNGSFSDMYSKRLPNGWKITLSKERYFSVDKVNYEGIGVPVDVRILNRRSDIELMNDSVLEGTLDELEKRER